MSFKKIFYSFELLKMVFSKIFDTKKEEKGNEKNAFPFTVYILCDYSRTTHGL